MNTALILAGSRQGAADPMAVAAGVSHKAMIAVGGQPMLLRVIRAVAAAGYDRIAVAIEQPELVDALSPLFPPGVTVEVAPAEAGPSLSVAAGLDRYGAPLLVTTADHALLQPDWVRWFVDHVPQDADLAAGLARSDKVMAAAPEGKRTFLRFSDGAFSGCNLFYIATPKAKRAIALWQEVEANRKHPLKVLARLGPGFALRYALGKLSLSAALARLGQLAGVKAAAVELPFGQAAIDVDKPEDLILVQRLVG